MASVDVTRDGRDDVGSGRSLSASARRGLAALGLGGLLLGLLFGLRCWAYLGDTGTAVVFEQLILPGLTGAFLAGVGLGLSGAVLQGLTRNPLASPGLLGVTAGAHLAIVVALVGFDARYSLVLAGFLGSLVALAATWFLVGPAGRHGARLALAGVAVTLAFSAAASALMLVHEQEVGGAFIWSAGSPLMSDWGVVLGLAPWIGLGAVIAMSMVRGLDLLALGASMARGLSASPERLTVAGFLAVGLASGAGVALTGPVAFIGLLAPNGLRRLGVRRHAWLVPASGLWGGALLVGADWVAQAWGASGQLIPVGVVTAVIGAPVFLALIAGLAGRDEGASGFTAGRRLPAAVLTVSGAWLVTAMLSLSLGESALTPPAVVDALVNGGSQAGFVVNELRLPRLLVASTAGGLLALAGAVLQAMLRNPLAGPETLGLVQAGALCSLLALLAGAPPGGWAMQASALAGCGGAVALVFAVARRSRLAPVALVLAGIALASLLSSLSALVVLKADLQATQALIWLAGSVYGRGWADWWSLLPTSVVVVGAARWLARRLDLMGLGDAKAATLGVGAGRMRALACLVAALATAGAVSVVGSLAFVGLLAPHMARLVRAGPLAVRLPVVVIVGAVLTALADLAGRTLLAPTQLPAGIMTSLIGAPYFLWLLRASCKHRVLS